VRSIDEADEGPSGLRGHVVVVGFGLAGRVTAQALHRIGVPFVVLELNAENVRRGKTLGLPVFYGDATSREALQHAHIQEARLVILLMNDPQAAERVVSTVKDTAPGVPVLMRTRYLSELERLYGIGAREIVAEEVEGAMEIISRALRALEIPRNEIDALLSATRAETQESARRLTVPHRSLREHKALDDLKIECLRVLPGAPLEGKTPAALQIRATTGALVVGVRRGERLVEGFAPDSRFELDDVVYFVGTEEALRSAMRRFGELAPQPSAPV
jgi:CPA2 family monovalent cation:H+ antiporter-2